MTDQYDFGVVLTRLARAEIINGDGCSVGAEILWRLGVVGIIAGIGENVAWTEQRRSEVY